MVLVVALFAVLAFHGVGHADIYEWTDGQGVRHFTNLKDELPEAQQTSPKVFVEDRHSTTAPETEAAPASAPAEPRSAQVVYYDDQALQAAFERGWQEGMDRFAGSSAPPGLNSLQINAPIIVSPSVVNPAYRSYRPYVPLINTSFDRGRSRHLTLRLLLQDQFAIDREGPYAYPERFLPPLHHPPLGPDLPVFLGRGFPPGTVPRVPPINY